MELKRQTNATRSIRMAQWYVQRASDVLGPLSPEDLLALVRSGSVKPDTKIRKQDSGWLAASEVGGLFEAAMRPTIENRCPDCDRLLDHVPCLCPKCGRRVQIPRIRIIENTINGDAGGDSSNGNNR